MGLTKTNPILNIFKDIFMWGFERFGRYYSSYRGFVVDNADPLGLQRLLLVIPEVSQDRTYAYWAIAKGVYYGEGYGMQLVPQKGDLVWVEFEHGHPEVPIWTFGHPGNKEMPTGDSDLNDINCAWFVSPYGHKIKINDTKKYISIETPSGNKILLNNKGLIDISNSNTSIKELLTDIITMYMKTKTISGQTLDPSSLNDATNNLTELTKLFV